MSKAFHYIQSTEEANNVEISVNAKGNVTFTVKAYGTSLATAKMKAVKVYRELQQEFIAEAPEREQGSKPLPRSS